MSLLSRAACLRRSLLPSSQRYLSSKPKQAERRIRRPKTQPPPPTEEPKMAGYGSRPHAITLFPGDYGDDLDPWGDEEEEEDLIGNFNDSEETVALQEAMRLQAAKEAENRERWRENAEPPVYTSKIDERGRAYGRGGRKRATARCWIQPGFGEVVVNKREFVDYFERMSDREHILEPLCVTETCGAFDLQVMVDGGGLTGQAGAVRLALANALTAYNPDMYRTVLKRKGLLTRDTRKVERKKIGHVKARKSPQWVRR